jgi:hypothetical protein
MYNLGPIVMDFIEKIKRENARFQGEMSIKDTKISMAMFLWIRSWMGKGCWGESVYVFV